MNQVLKRTPLGIRLPGLWENERTAVTIRVMRAIDLGAGREAVKPGGREKELKTRTKLHSLQAKKKTTWTVLSLFPLQGGVGTKPACGAPRFQIVEVGE